MGQSCSPNFQGIDGRGPPPLSDAPQRQTRLAAHEQENEPVVPIRIGSFAVARRRRGAGPSGETWGDGWSRWYKVRREIGRGVSAAVFEGEANWQQTTPRLDGRFMSTKDLLCSSSRPVSAATCFPEQKRRIAMKRFKKLKSRSFQTELAALTRIGIHPNVVRLLESFEDFEGEDVLILEYCDGSTLFDLFNKARARGELLAEVLVARLLRQLLLALDHVHSCGIDHQDVKPENMFLYGVSMPEQRAELKLGDFGWAVTGRPSPRGTMRTPSEVPPEGAGSLWYAPPELNPPVVLATNGNRPTRAEICIGGRSDMWSVGVVAYLLLVGKNPFHAALRMQESKSIETEVVRLVAMGQYDATCHRWVQLPPEVRGFVSGLLHVQAKERPSAADALRHLFLIQRLARCPEVAPMESAWHISDRARAWSRLDGLQRVGWASVARAAAEPELRREVVITATQAMRTSSACHPGVGAGDTAYLWHLARELSALPTDAWLRSRHIWPEVVRLAFNYLDVDADGFLSPQDLVTHLVVNHKTDASTHSDAWSAVHAWVSRWGGVQGRDCRGLTADDFHMMLVSLPFDEEVPLSSNLEGVLGDDELEEGSRSAEGHRCRGGALDEELCGWGLATH